MSPPLLTLRPAARRVLAHPGAFALRVLKGFRANQGLLLAGAVAYYALLSLVPLLILVMIVVPAAAARNVAANLRQFFWISLVLSSLSAGGGLLLSGFWPIPTGGAIAAVSGALFYLTLAARPLLLATRVRSEPA